MVSRTPQTGAGPLPICAQHKINLEGTSAACGLVVLVGLFHAQRNFFPIVSAMLCMSGKAGICCVLGPTTGIYTPRLFSGPRANSSTPKGILDAWPMLPMLLSLAYTLASCHTYFWHHSCKVFAPEKVSRFMYMKSVHMGAAFRTGMHIYYMTGAWLAHNWRMTGTWLAYDWRMTGIGIRPNDRSYSESI